MGFNSVVVFFLLGCDWCFVVICLSVSVGVLVSLVRVIRCLVVCLIWYCLVCALFDWWFL